MFAQLKLYKSLITGALVIMAIAGLYFYIGSLKTQIDKLEIKVSQWQVKYTTEQHQSDLLRNAVHTQNILVEQLKVDKHLADTKLTTWKAKPAIIKYKTINKVRTIKSDTCSDIKSTLNTIRQLDFDNL